MVYLNQSIVSLYRNMNLSKCDSLAARSYTKLPKELDHLEKVWLLFKIWVYQCFKWCLIRYIYPADHHPSTIIKIQKDISKELSFKDMKFPVKIRDIDKIENKKNVLLLLTFWLWKLQNISSLCNEKMLRRRTLIID